MLLDAHCHLDLLKNMTQFINEINGSKINILSVGTTPRAFEPMQKIVGDNKNIHIALGLHPQLVGQYSYEIELFERLFRFSKFIGEVGLDFSYNYYSTKAKQLCVFTRIAELCGRIGNKVISIHSVRSADIVHEILLKNKVYKSNICIFHWFSGNIPTLRKILECGGYVSINPKMLGSVNGKKIVLETPVERMLLESDAPFSMNTDNVSLLFSLLKKTIDGISMSKRENVLNAIENNSLQIFKEF